MSKHVHFLLHPKEQTLALLMRRLLTGYAVHFNLRHHRNGHRFQNRHPSTVCQEDANLLAWIRANTENTTNESWGTGNSCTAEADEG